MEIDRETPMITLVWPSCIQVLNNFLVEYNTMAKRGMDLVLFMAAAQHVSQVVWSPSGRAAEL